MQYFRYSIKASLENLTSQNGYNSNAPFQSKIQSTMSTRPRLQKHQLIITDEKTGLWNFSSSLLTNLK
ncbi:hypothetical protein OUZ56_012065 [Daphnia magna]|uniref:Uncharacterized protein n=1 Tax=Daphnia magna TaxID=35525 RepID=A0ABQ9Z396_9CRUS|nr:hypothetical protein OUZ56_012065 [Daphnia magna]